MTLRVVGDLVVRVVEGNEVPRGCRLGIAVSETVQQHV